MRVPVEAQNRAAYVLAAKIPDHIVGLFVEPVLLEGEDPRLYWNVVSAAIDEHQPASVLDWIDINDLVTKLWEERFHRRAANAAIRAGQRTAVEQFVTEIIPGDGRVKATNMAAREAHKYFTASKQEREEVRSQLGAYQMGEAEVLARSAQNNSDAIKMLEGMVSSRESTRRKLQKEMRRRRSSQGGNQKHVTTQMRTIRDPTGLAKEAKQQSAWILTRIVKLALPKSSQRLRARQLIFIPRASSGLAQGRRRTWIGAKVSTIWTG